MRVVTFHHHVVLANSLQHLKACGVIKRTEKEVSLEHFIGMKIFVDPSASEILVAETVVNSIHQSRNPANATLRDCNFQPGVTNRNF